MTEREIALGNMIFQRVKNVYNAHPEYKELNKQIKRIDRYEKFVTEMMKKYNKSRNTIVAQIHGGIFNEQRYKIKDYHKR